MKKIIINGSFLCRNLTGIERFSLEICKRLDSLDKNSLFELYVPKDAKFIPELSNLKITISQSNLKKFPLWDHFTFPKYVKKSDGISLDFANLTSLFQPGLVFIHDIYAKLYPQDFTSKKDKLRRFYMCWMYNHAIKKGKHIFTVSEFSKNQIIDTYKISSEKISVIPNGWDHFTNITEDNSVFSTFPTLKSKEYYFTLGSLQKRKNLIWLVDYASKHPEEIFAISGKAISGMVSNEIDSLKTLQNVILLGYVSDEQVKALMKNCKAFIFPSYYEGFGIPPLEALSVGAKIIVSDIPCFHEIYKNSAYYINPNNSDINIEDLLKLTVESPDTILDFYQYDNAAKKLYNEINLFVTNIKMR